MIKNIALIGLQNGDEGKGKITAHIADQAEKKLAEGERVLSYRFQGGKNAGHTVVVGENVYKLHQVSSAIVRPKTYCLLGKGMFLTVRNLYEEINALTEKGVTITPGNFGISSKTHVTFDYHISDDQAAFNLAEHTSTGSGIKQTARDKANRTGIRFVEFLDKELMLKILKEKIFPDGMPSGSYEDFVDSYDKEREFLKQFLVLEHDVFMEPNFKFWIAEGAQGMILDIDDGQYPGITSSNPGMPTHRPDKIVGVFKSYVSSVGIGERPFVSEMSKELQDKIVDEWQEFGTTTGKRRHIGWMDLVALKYTAETVHVDFLAATCLDRLETLAKHSEKVKVVVAYEIDGKQFEQWDISFDRRDTLAKAKPVFKEFDSWEKTVENGELTPNAQKYIDFIEEKVGKKIILIGTGPEHKDIIIKENII